MPRILSRTSLQRKRNSRAISSSSLGGTSNTSDEDRSRSANSCFLKSTKVVPGVPPSSIGPHQYSTSQEYYIHIRNHQEFEGKLPYPPRTDLSTWNGNGVAPQPCHYPSSSSSSIPSMISENEDLYCPSSSPPASVTPGSITPMSWSSSSSPSAADQVAAAQGSGRRHIFDGTALQKALQQPPQPDCKNDDTWGQFVDCAEAEEEIIRHSRILSIARDRGTMMASSPMACFR